MKCFEVSSSKAAFVALVLLVGLGLVIDASWAQRATTGDRGGVTAPKSSTAPPTTRVVQVLIPNLLGKTEGEAKKALSKVGLKLGKVRYQTVGRGTPGTVVQQSPTAKSKAAKGSAVDVVVLRAAAAKISPKIVQKGKKAYLEFPETVRDVIIYDHKGNKLQQFKKGKKFDITDSVIKTKAGRIKVAWNPLSDRLYMPGSPSGGTAVDTKHTADFDSSRYINEDVLKQKGIVQTAETTANIVKPEVDDTFIENGEPENNTRFDLLPGPKLYSGSVGGPDDPVDRLAFTSGPSPNGTVITVHVDSGNVNVTLYYKTDLTVNPLVEHGNGFWIAVLPSDYICFSVQSAEKGVVSPYTISVNYQYILNPNEAQQTEANPMQLHLGGGTRKGALIPRFNKSDWEDCFFVQVPLKQRLKIMVTDAGLPTGNRIKIRISALGSNGALEEVTGTYDEATLETQRTYPGTWKIQVVLEGPGAEFYGTGNIPSCYRKPYKIRVEEIPFPPGFKTI